MKKQHLLAVGVVLGAACQLFAAETPRTLTVTGTAEVAVAPDICYMRFVITTEHKSSAAEAYRKNNRLMHSVGDAIKEVTVDPKDIQTQNLTIAPQYHWDDKRDVQVFDGYKVSHTLAVKLRDIDKASDVLDAAVQAGATQVSGVDFTVENPKKYLTEARVEAIRAARTKAELMAETAGVRLLKPLSISEYEPGGWQRFAAQANVELDVSSWEAGESASLEPGEMKLALTVNITYEIQ